MGSQVKVGPWKVAEGTKWYVVGKCPNGQWLMVDCAPGDNRTVLKANRPGVSESEGFSGMIQNTKG